MPNKLAVLTKWRLHRFYARYPKIAGYLPQTALFTSQALATYLQKYNAVYIKSSIQHTGKGIVKAWKSSRGYHFVKVRGKVHTAATVQALYELIRKTIPKHSFIIQRAIDLAQLNGRLFDIRVMMMRDEKRTWQYAGMLAKVSGAGSVISNVQRGGGYTVPIEEALSKSLHLPKASVEELKRQMILLSQTIMAYSESYPFFSFQCGIDLAVDKKGKIWIIEVNLHNPSHGLFRRLLDKTFFRRIGRLYWAYRKHNKRII